jgi:pimeloyl-ACP methyl ester carboxylesterase
VQVERYGMGGNTFLGLHGWGGDHTAFAPLAAALPPDASFYSADLPGCGKSAPPEEWSLEAIVAEIIATARKLDSKRLTIVGHCGGAVFGLLAARAARQLIGRVLAIDPFAYLPRYFSLFTGEGFGRRAYDATFANPLGRWVTSRALNAGRDDRTDLTASFGATDHEVARRYLQLFAAMGGVEEVRGLRAEVDLVYGERTFGAVKKSVALLREALPHARVFQLQGARHMPLTESTAQLAQLIFESDDAARESQVKRYEPAEGKESRVKV